MREEEEEAAAAESKWQVKSTIYSAAPFKPQRKRIRTVDARSWAKKQIQPYTWQPWRATFAGHSAHYAWESRNCHHGPREIVLERSNPVQMAAHWAHIRVTSHPSQHSARYRVSGGAVTIKHHP